MFRPVVAALLLALSGATPAEAVPALVTGADALNIRRGPGTEHPAFARLERGQQVEVTKVTGTWASVRTQGGAEGWVQKQYLTIQGEPPRGEERPPPEPTRAVPDVKSDELQHLRDENARLQAERDTLREKVASAPASAAAPDSAKTQADIQQLLQLTQELRQMVASQRERGSSAPVSESAEHDSWLLTNGWVLTASLVLGVLGGMVYGRAQERRRRNRIRF